MGTISSSASSSTTTVSKDGRTSALSISAPIPCSSGVGYSQSLTELPRPEAIYVNTMAAATARPSPNRPPTAAPPPPPPAALQQRTNGQARWNGEQGVSIHLNGGRNNNIIRDSNNKSSDQVT